MITKKIIKQATDYSNLSQWIEMEIWKYMLTPIKERDSIKVADRVIKRVLADKNTVNNAKHKEGFDAGYKKGFKSGFEHGLRENNGTR